jgi:MoaA/NifB/PqqE/SkfB family radical SAM enzyme
MKRLLERLLGRPKRFSAWQIELTTRCPLACRMCIRQGREWRNADMDFEDFARIAPHLRDVETVILQGWGEPLLHPRLVDIVRLAKSQGRDAAAVGFVTSGKGMDRRYAADLVEAGIDFLGFSFAGASADTHCAIRVNSDFGELVSASEDVQTVKREKGLERPRTHVAFLMMKENLHEVPALPDLAHRVGASEIVLTNLIDAADAWQDAQKAFRCDGHVEHAELLDQAERRARELGLGFRRASLVPRSTPVCEEDPLRNLFITVDGEVAPCVYLCPPVSEEFTRWFCGCEHRARRISFGNVLREPLDAIWESPQYVAFRDGFARRARRHRLLTALGGAGAAAQAALPEPPAPCRTCHKMLGV